MANPTPPTTREIADNLAAQITAGRGPELPRAVKSFIRVFSVALSGVIVLIYKYGGFNFLQMFVKTASNENTVINGRNIVPLQEWGKLSGAGLPIRATQAQLTVSATVINQTGFVTNGTVLIGVNNGVTYVTNGDVSLDAPTITLTVIATSDQQGGDASGPVGNLLNGSIISFANAPENLARDTTVTGTTIEGVKGESTDVYRDRVFNRFQKRPQGGALADYLTWALETPNVINAYPYTGVTPGSVNTYIEAGTGIDGIPTVALLTETLKNISFDSAGRANRAPLSTLPNTLAITRTAFDVRVLGISGVSSLPAVQAQIEASMTDYFLSKKPYIVGLDLGSRTDIINQSEAAAIVTQLVQAAGGTYTSLILEESAVPFTSRILVQGEKAKVGAVTYV